MKRCKATAFPNLWRIHRAIEPEYGQTCHPILVPKNHFNMYLYNINKQVKQTKNLRTKKNYLNWLFKLFFLFASFKICSHHCRKFIHSHHRRQTHHHPYRIHRRRLHHQYRCCRILPLTFDRLH